MKLTLELIEGWRAHVACGDHLSPEATLALLDSARALARMEAWLRSDSVPGLWIEPRAESDDGPVYFAVIVDRTQIDEEGETIAAAIHKALDGAEVLE